MALTDLKTATRYAEALFGLAEPNRIRIVEFLLDGPKSVGEIAKAIKSEIVNTSHHLSMLRQAGLVESEKDGRFVIYSLHPKVSPRKGGKTLDLGWCKVVVS